MCIAIVSETHFLGSNNAVSARVWNYAQALRAAGDRVLLLSYRDFRQGDEIGEKKTGIMAYLGTGRQNCSVGQFLKRLSELVCSENVKGILFYPTPNPSFELRFLWWKHRTGFRNVFCEINEVRRFEQTYVKTFSLPKRMVYKFITAETEKLVRHYKGIICISENIRRYFAPFNDNALVIPILSDVPKSMPSHHKGKGEIMRFVFTGSVAIEKENLVELLRGFYAFNKEYSEWVFLLYGKAPEQNKKRLITILDILNLSSKVHLIGEVEHTKIAEVLSSADCLILPRRNTKQNFYGFSTKLSEYAVSGTPIILTDTGVVFDYFTDGVDCLKVKGYEAQDFCEQMRRFISMSAEEESVLAQNAFNTANSYFNWEMYSDILKKFLNQ